MSDNPVQRDFDDELLSAYLDDELSADESALVEARLAADPAARQMLDQLRHVSQAVRGLPPETPNGDLRESILRRVSDGARTTPWPDSKKAARSLPKFTIGRTRRGWIWASLAVAAALLIMFVDRDSLENGERRDIAQRSRERPALTAAPESGPPAVERQPAARGLAESELTAEPMALVDRAATGRSSRTEELATVSPLGPAEPLDEDDLVVVHVLARRKALETGAFDRLLLSNGIALAPEAPLENVVATDDRSRAFASSTRAAGRGAAPPADPDEVDVVLLEAPPTKIKSFVSDLNRDYANFLSVSVDDSAPADETAVPESAPTKKLAVELKQYNRGNVPPQQKEFLSRNKAFYYEQSPAGGYVAGAAGKKLDVAGQIEQENKRRFASDRDAGQGRAQRVAVSKSEEVLADKLGKLRQWKAPLAPNDDNLQVLFVVAPGEEPTASPPAKNRAE